ncbi:MAG TPA: FAD-binding oxidoreductase [Bryobacteraceae bacterium]
MIEVHDASGYTGHADRLLAPKSATEAAAILKEASDSNTPVTIAGNWTGLAGGACPTTGWILSLENLKHIAIEKDYAIAGAGASLVALQSAAKTSNQFYAPDPTENTASVGGTIATNASGSRSFLYKATREHVVALTVAQLDGSLHTFRRGDAIDFPVRSIHKPDTTKHSVAMPLAPGMDWVDLFIGSEGTLGVVVEAQLKLLPEVRDLLTGVLFFETEESVWDAVEAWRATPALRMLEYLDSGSLNLMETTPGGAQAALIIEQELRAQSDEDLWVERMDTEGLLEPHSWIASGETDREKFRKFRHGVPERVNATVIRNGFTKLGSDAAVPLDRMKEMMLYYREIVQPEFAGQFAIFGHIGDAHVHVNLLPKTKEQSARGHEMMAEIARKAASLNGSVSAEHGLGKRKKHFLPIQYSAGEIASLLEVKRRFDPKGLLGQGNLFPDVTQ